MKSGYRQTIYASYIGYITQAIVNNLAPLLFVIFRDEFGLSLSNITFFVTINFFIQLFVDFAATKFVDKIGYRKCIIAAHICCAAGLISMAVLPMIIGNAFVGLLISVAIYAVGGGLIEVLISPIVEACPTDNKVSVMSLLHSFYCWGTVLVIVLTTLSLHFFSKNSWHVVACVWAAVPIANAFLFAKVPINTLTEENEGMKNKELFKNKMFWLFVLLMVTAGASEQAMSQWASAFAETGLGVSKTIGDLAGPCLFSILMGTARAVNARLTARFNITVLMIVSGALCIASYLLASLSGNAVIALAGCGLCGLSVGIMWPGAFSMASQSFPKGGTSLFALLALAGDLGCMSGPTLVGEIAGAAGDSLKTGLLFSIAFPIMLIVCCLVLKRKKA